MTLPHGFGSSRCQMDNCDGFKHGSKGHYDNVSCTNYGDPSISIPISEKFRIWRIYNSDMWKVVVTVSFIVVMVVLSTTVYPYIIFHYDGAYTIIDGFNCNQLAEYVADRGDRYNYAEHRYEWLCVTEKIKEFQ